MFDFEKSTPDKLEPLADLKKLPRNSLPNFSLPKLAPKLARERIHRLKTARDEIIEAMNAPDRSAPVKLAPLRFAPRRFTPDSAVMMLSKEERLKGRLERNRIK